ncbi:MAG: hypothetical protein GXO23_05260 [Crenarchaeota archaeon]|nr:hypothetical protein [Thermoproteota archaeon]
MPIVYVDSREYRKAQDVIKELRRLGATVVEKMLEIGDYIVSERVAIERKSARDFAKSIIDGRLFEQAKNLRDKYEKPIIIVEGNLWRVEKHVNMNVNCILGALVSLLVRFNVTVLFSRDKSTTAYLIYDLAKMEQEKEKRGLKTYVTKKSLTLRELQVQFLASLPGIGQKRAEKILEEFKTPQNALTNVRLWTRVGVPESTVFLIRKILQTPYSESEEIVERQVKIDDVVKQSLNDEHPGQSSRGMGILRYLENSDTGNDGSCEGST